MTGFFAALRFLTAIPIGTKHADAAKLPAAIIYFPVIGLLLGLTLAGMNNLLAAADLDTLLLHVALVVALIVLTGGLHLDGLADTVDALASGKDRDRMLEIMRDPHIGTMGVISVVSALLLKVSLIGAVGTQLRPAALVLMCVVSRWSLVFSMSLFPYARREGKAKVFTDGIRPAMAIAATVMTILAALAAAGVAGLVVLLVAAASAYGINRFFSAKLGGITGDTLGAMSEIQEIVALITVCVLQKMVV